MTFVSDDGNTLIKMTETREWGDVVNIGFFGPTAQMRTQIVGRHKPYANYVISADGYLLIFGEITQKAGRFLSLYSSAPVLAVTPAATDLTAVPRYTDPPAMVLRWTDNSNNETSLNIFVVMPQSQGLTSADESQLQGQVSLEIGNKRLYSGAYPKLILRFECFHQVA